MRASKFFRSAVQPITFRRVGDETVAPGIEGWGTDTIQELTIPCLIQETVSGVDPTKEVVYGASATATCFVPIESESLTSDLKIGDSFLSPKGLEYGILEITEVKEGPSGKVIGDFTVAIRGVKQ